MAAGGRQTQNKGKEKKKERRPLKLAGVSKVYVLDRKKETDGTQKHHPVALASGKKNPLNYVISRVAGRGASHNGPKMPL